jgi:prefoldin subunit 5
MFLTEFVQAFADELRRLVEDFLRGDGPTGRLRKMLRVMYGRGEVSRDKFHRLMNMLDRGFYIEGEILSLHRQAVNRGGIDNRPISRDIARSLEYVYLNRARLDEARLEMHRASQLVDTQRQWMTQQVEDFHQRAQSALPDEEAARRYLEIRQELMEQLQILTGRFKNIQQEIDRIDVLDAQLRLSESELIMVDSRERLAGVEGALNKRLYS